LVFELAFAYSGELFSYPLGGEEDGEVFSCKRRINPAILN
jgi:hypothetical protein